MFTLAFIPKTRTRCPPVWYVLGVLVLVCLLSPVVQAGGLRFEHVMTESGVSVAETNAIVQD
ncbi:MAG TPA: hypothetical protein VLE50_09130, partial [Cellvibrio sp.]|nr:hypothetical protein [Cellvibrio sp.]